MIAKGFTPEEGLKAFVIMERVTSGNGGAMPMVNVEVRVTGGVGLLADGSVSSAHGSERQATGRGGLVG
jgi:hypothetical protein